MFRLAVVALILAGTASCSPPCDKDHLCSIDSDGALCDGSSFRACDNATRGATVGCGATPRVAICTPTGWTFQNAPKAPDGGQ